MKDLPANITVLFAFSEIINNIMKIYDESKPDHNPNETKILLFLDEAKRMKHLSDALFLKPSNMTAIIDGMEKRGLIERVSCPSDRRATLIQLTRLGSKTRGMIISKLERIIDANSPLSKEAFDDIGAILLKSIASCTEH